MSTRKYPAPRAVPQRIYQLHVSLVDIQPTVWRRLWVADTLTLARLDRVIQAAMGWTNSHLHEFVIAGRRYGIPLTSPVNRSIRAHRSEPEPALDDQTSVFRLPFASILLMMSWSPVKLPDALSACS